jgi:hypothetical protein
MTALIVQLQILSFWTLVRFPLILGDVNVNETLFKIVGGFAGFVGGGSALSFLSAGYLWLFAGDNHQQELRARQIFGGAVIGAVVAVAAVTFAKIVTSSVVTSG